jgi:hypothetical protein
VDIKHVFTIRQRHPREKCDTGTNGRERAYDKGAPERTSGNSRTATVYLVGNFDVYDVNDFNAMLIKMKADLEISAFLYKNCTRLEAIIKETG